MKSRYLEKIRILNAGLFLLSLSLFIHCSENNSPQPTPIARDFEMGFTSWPYGPTSAAAQDTYVFIQENGNIYSEHLDDRIPWDSWINDTPLPSDFVQAIDYKVGNKNPRIKLTLSVSILNNSRDDLKEGWDGSPISYTALNEIEIENAYYKHVEYLVERFQPDYLIISMEANDLLKNSPEKWNEYKLLMNQIRPRLKNRFPTLPISESMTLHNFYQPQVDNPSAYIEEIASYAENFDFAAISFYPFFKNQHSKTEYQAALDFLHSEISKPIAFVETAHLSEDLVIPNLNTNIKGNVTEQKEYLEVLIANAASQNYEFIIWWAHRDYDALWETFPPEVKDLGQIWRDTGLLDEDGNERPAFDVWLTNLNK